MVDIQSISSGLKLADDGIWYSQDNQNISYPSEGNENCFAVEDSSFWFRHRNNCIASIVKTYPPEDNGTIFDIGGGNGFVSFALANAGFNVALLEPGSVGASNAKKRGLKNVICATTDTAKLKQPLRQPSGDHGPGARDSQSRHHHPSGQEGRLFEKDSPHGRGNVDPAVWFRTELEYSLSYAVPGWGVCRPHRWIGSISLGQFTNHPGANSTIADYRPTSRTIS